MLVKSGAELDSSVPMSSVRRLSSLVKRVHDGINILLSVHSVRWLCPDCDKSMLRSEYRVHRPFTSVSCVDSPLPCPSCLVVVPPVRRAAHLLSAEHQLATIAFIVSSHRDLQGRHLLLEQRVKELEERNKEKERDTQLLRDQIKMMIRECDERLRSVESPSSSTSTSSSSCYSSSFDESHTAEAFTYEYTLRGWNTIVPGIPVFSIDCKRSLWGRYWWLKIVKGTTHVGLYLCGDSDTLPLSELSSLVVHYQLMVRAAHTDKLLHHTPWYKTTFGKEHAWGISNLVSLDRLQAHAVDTYGNITLAVRFYTFTTS